MSSRCFYYCHFIFLSRIFIIQRILPPAAFCLKAQRTTHSSTCRGKSFAVPFSAVKAVPPRSLHLARYMFSHRSDSRPHSSSRIIRSEIPTRDTETGRYRSRSLDKARSRSTLLSRITRSMNRQILISISNRRATSRVSRLRLRAASKPRATVGADR